MVSASLRQNGGRAPEQNPFTPGKTPKEWTETRTREAGHDQWPHPENPGLIADSLGYYDWAGRRLFLSDGSPDPETPGAYRYQTRPDLCDPHATDDDPASPRYEPPHLRHKPGDEWMIGGKAYDPDDPGPFGSPGWRPDRRTGRHRRGERPDPIPPWEWQPGDPEPPDFARTRIKWDAYGDWTPERIARSGRPEDGAGRIPDREDPQRPDGATESDSSDDNDTGSGSDSGWNSGSCTGIGFRWSTGPTRPEAPQGFTRMQEEAFRSFMSDSAELAAAHLIPVAPYFRERLGWILRWLLCVAAFGFIPTPRPLAARSSRTMPRAARGKVPSRRKAEGPPIVGPASGASSPPLMADFRPVSSGRAAGGAAGFSLAAARFSAGAAAGRAAASARRLARDSVVPRAVPSAAVHWRSRPRQSRLGPSPMPYAAQWEQAFDSQAAYGGAAL
jgi:hypothetical protein